MAGFFAMGGYAVFVWPAYIVSVAVLGAAVVVSLLAHAKARKTVRELEAETAEAGENQT
jgi:heme exporter protein CcmD